MYICFVGNVMYTLISPRSTQSRVKKLIIENQTYKRYHKPRDDVLLLL